MGCCFGCIGLVAPRLATLFLWLFTNLVTRAFASVLFPLLGIIFLPFTTLVYVLVYAPGRGVTGLGWVCVIVAFFMDFGTYGGAGYSDRKRLPGYGRF
jgi:hypothetical protein